MAHDIKTPLTVIKGNAELLMEDEITIENREFLSDIQTSVNTIEKYLELLMFAVNHNTLPVSLVPIETDRFKEQLLSVIQPMCKIKNIVMHLKNNVTFETIDELKSEYLQD